MIREQAIVEWRVIALFFTLALFGLVLTSTSNATAESQSHWEVELSQLPADGLTPQSGGCLVRSAGGFVYFSGFGVERTRALPNTSVWDQQRWAVTDDDSPLCWCSPATYDGSTSQPTVFERRDRPDGMHLSTWNGEVWEHASEIAPDTVSMRSQPILAWDADRNELLLYGGLAPIEASSPDACLGKSEVALWSCYRDTWSFNGTQWTMLDDGCGDGPYPGCEPDSAAWDPVNARVRMVDVLSDRVRLFEFEEGWRLVEESTEFHHGKLARVADCTDLTNLALDPATGNWLGFGGIERVVDGQSETYSGFWGWSGVGGWQAFLHPSSTRPAGQRGARLGSLGPGEFLMVGGHSETDGRDNPTNETWRLELRRKTEVGGADPGCCATAPASRRRSPVLLVLLGFLLGARALVATRWTQSQSHQRVGDR